MPTFAGRGAGWGSGGDASNSAGAFETVQFYQEVDADEAATLGFMREEEKLARDVYLQLYEQWQAPLFNNIANAEQRHMDAVKDLLDKYALPDPTDPDDNGVYSNAVLQQLYNDLMTRGAESYLEALRVGAYIEEIDIEDNQMAIEATDNEDLKALYDKLLRGSRNHLRAFVGTIERLGVVYEAQYLDQDLVDAIADTPTERGNAAGRGGSRGFGSGTRYNL
jgi:hypothetical protein